MDFFIITLGDAEFLWNVMKGVSALFSPGMEGTMNTLIKIAAMLGFIAMLAKGLSGGGGFAPGQFLGAFILYMAMFMPKVDVYVQDYYTGTTYTTSNIPIGVALVGHTTSLIGTSVTELFDQAYSLPNSNSGLSTKGYISGIDILMSTRKSLRTKMGFPDANRTDGGNFATSWTNYFRECTLMGIDLELLDMDEIVNSNDLINAVKFDSAVYFTEVDINGTPSTETCAQAHTTLTGAYMTTVLNTTLGDLAPAILGSEQAITSGNNTGLVSSELQNALASVGMLAFDTQKFMAMSMLQPLMMDAINGKYENDKQWTAALAINNAINQRNVQWMADQDMFQSTFRPLYAFVEGMVYAVSPLMAVLIVMGGFGIAVVGKQLVTLAWIAMWTPLMAVANMYIYIAVRSNLDAIAGANDNGMETLSGMFHMDSELQTYVAVGAKMAASAPALAAFLVYGSSVALTNLANKFGGDHFNEKSLSPDILPSGQMISQQPMLNSDDYYGQMRGSMEGNLGSFNTGDMASKEVASTSEAAIQDQKNLQRTWSNITGMDAQHGLSSSQAREFSNVTSSEGSKGYTATRNSSRDVANAFGFNYEKNQAFQQLAQLSAGISLGTGSVGQTLQKSAMRDLEAAGASTADASDILSNNMAGKTPEEQNRLRKVAERAKGKGGVYGMIADALGVNFQANAQGGWSAGAVDRATEGTSAKAVFQAMGQAAKSHKLGENMAYSVKNGEVDMASLSFSEKDQQQLSNAASRSVTSAEKFAEANKLATNVGAGTSWDAKGIATNFAGDQQLVKDAQQMNPEAYKANQALASTFMPGKHQAQEANALAAFMTLRDNGGLSNIAAAFDRYTGNDAPQAGGAAPNRPTAPVATDPMRNSDMPTSAPVQGMKDEVNAAANKVGSITPYDTTPGNKTSQVIGEVGNGLGGNADLVRMHAEMETESVENESNQTMKKTEQLQNSAFAENTNKYKEGEGYRGEGNNYVPDKFEDAVNNILPGNDKK